MSYHVEYLLLENKRVREFRNKEQFVCVSFQ